MTTVAEGTNCLATGTYGGDANHAGSTGSASVTITPGSNPITFTSMIVTATAPGGTVTFNLGAQTYCTVAEAKDASNSPIPGAALVTLTSGTWAQCNVLANQSGGGNYGSATQEAVGLSVTP